MADTDWDDISISRRAEKILRKDYLFHMGELMCDRCPYHRGENVSRRTPRGDRYKSDRKGR